MCLRGKVLTCYFIVLFLALWAGWSYAASASFSWLPNSETDLAGYRIYYGNASGVYTGNFDCHLPATGSDGRVKCSVSNMPDQDTFAAVVAYDTDSNESGYSNEIALNCAPSPPDDFKGIMININVEIK